MTPLKRPFHPLLNLAKIFCINSSSSPTRINKSLIFYNVIVVILYSVIVFLRVYHSNEEQFYALNKVVIDLHLICYTLVFCSNIVSNWTNSKKFHLNLLRLELFDHNLAIFGAEQNYKKMKRVFDVSLGATSVIFLLIAVLDYVIDVAFDDSKLIVNWLSIYLPITMNYFVSFVITFTLSLLNERYTRLESCFYRIQAQDKKITVKQFTNAYLELTQISNSILSHFSLQISTMFLLIFVVATSDLYLFLNWHLNVTQYIIMVNFMLIHSVEMITIILAYYWTNLKALECYFLIKENRFSVKILGMFTLDPTTLLSIFASVVSYLIILIQFTGSKNDVDDETMKQ
ncbi:7tm 7 domain containing protein, partial [Asbolus verrucosus]